MNQPHPPHLSKKLKTVRVAIWRSTTERQYVWSHLLYWTSSRWSLPGRW